MDAGGGEGVGGVALFGAFGDEALFFEFCKDVGDAGFVGGGDGLEVLGGVGLCGEELEGDDFEEGELDGVALDGGADGDDIPRGGDGKLLRGEVFLSDEVAADVEFIFFWEGGQGGYDGGDICGCGRCRLHCRGILIC